jgi:hypothetical protein
MDELEAVIAGEAPYPEQEKQEEGGEPEGEGALEGERHLEKLLMTKH